MTKTEINAETKEESTREIKHAGGHIAKLPINHGCPVCAQPVHDQRPVNAPHTGGPVGCHTEPQSVRPYEPFSLRCPGDFQAELPGVILRHFLAWRRLAGEQFP